MSSLCVWQSEYQFCINSIKLMSVSCKTCDICGAWPYIVIRTFGAAFEISTSEFSESSFPPRKAAVIAEYLLCAKDACGQAYVFFFVRSHQILGFQTGLLCSSFSERMITLY